MTSPSQRQDSYKWDKILILSDELFGQKLKKNRFNKNAACQAAFPSDYQLCLFSHLAYKTANFRLFDDWELLTTATNTSKTNGYFGVAFWNPILCQVVVAHRGTDKSNTGALINDAQLAFKSAKTSQSQSAATFVQRISEAIKAENGTGPPFIRLSLTGHSLGAWLAQITAFTVKYLRKDGDLLVDDQENYTENIHAHTVVFESPGCYESLKKLSSMLVPRYEDRQFANYKRLDMTVYLSKLNFINSVNHQTGNIYMVAAESHSILEILGLFDQETHKIDRQILLDAKAGIGASTSIFFKRMFGLGSSEKHVLKKDANNRQCSLNVFTEEELEFVKDWVHVVRCDSSSVQDFKETNSLPDFEIDYEYNTIESENLERAIAVIKQINPTKSTAFSLLEQNIRDAVFLSIFNSEASYFQDHLRKFYYFFQDRYNLTDFLLLNKNILHVVNTYITAAEFETNILYNVLISYQRSSLDNTLAAYLKPDRYRFLKWNRLERLKQCIKQVQKDVKLLVVDCFGATKMDEKFIFECLDEWKGKLIMLSTDDFDFDREKVRVDGLCSNVKFEYLTRDSQECFLNQKNLKLHTRKLSLNDILQHERDQKTAEFYKHIDGALPVPALLDLLFTPSIEPVSIDCPYATTLSTVFFHDVYRPISDISRESDCEDVLFIVENESDKELFKRAQMKSGDFETDCLSNLELNKTVYEVITRNNEVFINRLFNKDLYVPRNIYHRRMVNPEVFHSVNEDIYYFYGEKSKFYKMLPPNSDKERFIFVNSLERAKERLKKTVTNAHLLHIDNDNEIQWVRSNSSIQSLFPYMDERLVPETEVVKEPLTIISGEPGMGKSSTIGYLFLKLTQTHWPFVVHLKHAAFDVIGEVITHDMVAEFVLRSCKLSVNYMQYLLAYCLQHSTKLPVYIMFDAYDEIHDKESREKFAKVVDFLKDSSPAGILITTRKFRCKQLENRISVFASEYQLFEEPVIVRFVSTFWYSYGRLFNANIQFKEIQEKADELLENAQLIFDKSICNFIGRPLLMRIIAEVISLQNIPGYLKSMVLYDIVDLYQKYINYHYKIYFSKIGIQGETPMRWLTEAISNKLHKMAVVKMVDGDTSTIEYVDANEFNHIGIVQLDTSDNFDYAFIHPSVGDYFVADLLKLWLESKMGLFYYEWDVGMFIASELFCLEKFKEIRLFLDCHLTVLSVCDERINICRSKFKQLSQNDNKSILHICVKEKFTNLIRQLVLKILDDSDKCRMLIQHNDEMSTPLLLSLNMVIIDKGAENILSILLEEINQLPASNIKEILLSTFFVHSVSENHFEEFSRHLKHGSITEIFKQVRSNFHLIVDFLDECKFNNTTKINKILQLLSDDSLTRRYLLLATNQRLETCLHLTNDISLVKKFVELKANINAQDYHGMTPLNRAIKEGNTDIAKFLIKEGALFTEDYMLNSPLACAAKYNNFEIVKLLASRNIDIDSRNRFEMTPLMQAAKGGNKQIVEYLLTNGANVNAVDWNGMTALYYAVRGDHTNLIATFKKHHADFDIVDSYQRSPVCYSINKNLMNMVNSLVDNGASVNFKGASDEFPLDLLIDKNKPKLVEKFKAKGAQGKKQVL